MIEILAAETAIGASPLATWGPVGAIVLLLGGQKGIEALIVAWRGKKAHSNGNGGSTKSTVCPAHEGLVKLLDERHQALKGEIEEVKGNVKELRKENQENFKEVFQMLRGQTHRNGDS